MFLRTNDPPNYLHTWCAETHKLGHTICVEFSVYVLSPAITLPISHPFGANFVQIRDFPEDFDFKVLYTQQFLSEKTY